MKRVLILGSGGAGKSTLAKAVSEIIGVPVIHLDSQSWLPGWVEMPKDEMDLKINELALQDEWVMDGNYSKTLPLRIERADTVIYLDMPRLKCIYRILKRRVQYHNKVRPDIGEGCPERMTMEFFKWVWNYPKRSRDRILGMLKNAHNKDIHILKNNKEVRDFISKLSATYST